MNKENNLLPVYDIRHATNSSSVSRRNAIDNERAAEIVEALKTCGYVYLKTNLVTQAQLDNMMAHADKFFQLPSETKVKYQMNSKFEAKNGYMGLDFERLDQKYGGAVEWKESLNVYDLTVPFGPDAHCPGFGNAYYDFFRRCKDMLMIVLKYLAIGLKLEDENIFEGFYRNPGTGSGSVTMMRILNYPKMSKSETLGVVRCAAHVDYDLVTLNFQDNASGLEMFNRKHNRFVKTPSIEGTVMVQMGMVMEKMTNGAFIGTQHRVVKVGEDGTGNRRSISFFGQPDNDVLIKNIFRYNEKGEEGEEPVMTSLELANHYYQASFDKNGV